MKKLLAVLALLLTLSAPVFAAETKLIMPKPPEVSDYIKSPMPYGQGVLHKFFLKVYETSLWTDAKTWSMKQPFALSIRYAMNFSAKELIDRTFQEMERTGPIAPEQKQAYREKFTKLFPDVKRGDVITAVFLPSRGAVFYYNGKSRGTVEDIAFAKRFFNIWLGPATSEPDLRDRLLAVK